MVTGAGLINVLPVAAQAPLHGIGLAKGCETPTPIGDSYTCSFIIGNSPVFDTALDTLTITNLVDVVHAAGGDVTSPNLLPGSTLVLGGGATCNAGQTLCTLPPNSSIELNGINLYTVQPGDFLLPGNILPDEVTVTWQAHCQPGITNCPVGDQLDNTGSQSTIVKNPSNTVTSVQQGGNAVTSVPLGTSVTDQAVVTPGPGSAPGLLPTGTVDFSFFTTGNCTGPSTASSGTIGAGGIATSASSGPLTVSGATNHDGMYSFSATYLGDGSFNGSSGVCEPFIVNQAASDTVTNVQQGGVNVTNIALGTAVTDHAVVTGTGAGTPTGTVTFTFYNNGSCDTTLPGDTGTVGTPITLSVTGTADSAPSPALTVSGSNSGGSYSYSATYNGDTNYKPSTGVCEPFSVVPAVTVTLTNVQAGGVNTTSVPSGTPVTDQATVSGSGAGTPTGTVDFKFFNNGTCAGTGTDLGNFPLDASGVANTGPSAPLTVGGSTDGSYSYLAHYNGDTNYNASTGACEPVAVTPNNAVVVTVITQGGAPLSLPATVNAHTSVVDMAMVSPAPGTPPGAPAPTGSVSFAFFHNGNCSGSPADTTTGAIGAGGVASSGSEGPLTTGSYSFLATYVGPDPEYNAGATSTCEPLVVNALPSATVTTPQSGGNPVTTSLFAPATVSDNVVVSNASTDTTAPTPTGTVDFTFYTTMDCSGTGTAAGSPTLDAAGKAISSSEPGLLPGAYSFKATYLGDSIYAGSTGACEPITVIQRPSATVTTVESGGVMVIGPLTAPASVTDSATVTDNSGAPGGPTPTGNVEFTFFSTGNCTGTATPAGTGALNASGVATTPAAITGLLAGSYSFSAKYDGDAVYTGSTGTCEPFQVVQLPSAVHTTVTSGGNPVTGPLTAPASVTDTGTVTPATGVTGPTPTGTVSIQFYTGTAANPCATASGAAVSATLDATGSFSGDPQTGLTTGSYGYIVTYNGDSTYTGSVGVCEPFSVQQLVSQTNTTVLDSAGNPVTGPLTPPATVQDSATVTGSGPTPTGTVSFTFFTNGNCTAPGTSAGANIPLSATGTALSNTESGLGSGSYSFEATYNGDTTYKPSTSGCEPFTVSSPFTANFTPGYWKNHPAATSSHLPQTLGNYVVTSFSGPGGAQQILSLMGCGSVGALNCMAGMLLAADLNLAQGGNTCIEPTIAQANALLIKYSYHGPARYVLSPSDQILAMQLHDTLSAYNIDGVPTC
jgi:hypothetical protein